MAIRNGDRAEISMAKLVEYALNPGHPDNRDKWLAFRELGFRVLTVDQRAASAANVAQQLRAALVDANPLRSVPTPWGERIVVETATTGPNGRTAMCVSIWQYDPERDVPRLVTLWLRVRKVEGQ